MAIETVPHWQFTVDDVQRMLQAGILRDDSPVELLDGELRRVSPIGDRHFATVLRLSDLFYGRLRERVLVSVQMPIRLSDRDEPEPDLVLLRRTGDLPRTKPTAADALLVVEVSDSTVRYDIGEKVLVYARRGVAEVWVVDLTTDTVLTFLAPRPEEARYAVTGRFGRGQSLAPAFAPDTTIDVGDILGPVE